MKKTKVIILLIIRNRKNNIYTKRIKIVGITIASLDKCTLTFDALIKGEMEFINFLCIGFIDFEWSGSTVERFKCR